MNDETLESIVDRCNNLSEEMKIPAEEALNELDDISESQKANALAMIVIAEASQKTAEELNLLKSMGDHINDLLRKMDAVHQLQDICPHIFDGSHPLEAKWTGEQWDYHLEIKTARGDTRLLHQSLLPSILTKPKVM